MVGIRIGGLGWIALALLFSLAPVASASNSLEPLPATLAIDSSSSGIETEGNEPSTDPASSGFHAEPSDDFNPHVEAHPDGQLLVRNSADDSDLEPQAVSVGSLALTPEVAVAGAAVAAIALGGSFGLWPAFKSALGRLLPAMGLYARLSKEDALENPLRARMLQLVEAEPGIHFMELVRRLNLRQGIAQHHLRKLAQLELVSKVDGGGYSCYFPFGRVDRRHMSAASVLKSDGARNILATIASSPGVSTKQVCTRTQLTPTAVRFHLKRLQASGLLEYEQASKARLFRLTDLGRNILPASSPLEALPALAAAPIGA